MIDFNGLFIEMAKRKLKRKDIIKNTKISTSTLSKISKNECINTEVIDRICKYFDCQPGDIMKHIPDEIE